MLCRLYAENSAAFSSAIGRCGLASVADRQYSGVGMDELVELSVLRDMRSALPFLYRGYAHADPMCHLV